MTDNSSDAAWVAAQRAEVEAYLAAEEVQHGGVPEEPAWYEPEVLAIWPVSSAQQPASVGWWAVSGDVPTDYVTATPGMDERSALAAIAARWREAAARMAAGEPSPDLTIGAPEDWPELAPMLRSRAQTLTEWAADDELWA